MTSQTSLAVVPGVGSTNVQVAPESVLLAIPQFVPTNTLFAASGRTEMPNADGSVLRAFEQVKPPGGVAVAGFDQVAPASELTSMPASELTRPSYHDVA